MKAPEIKHYISWLGRVGYRNIDCSFSYDEASYGAIDRIFRLLYRLEPDPEHNSWELWLRAERGTIEDFGSFEDLREDGQVESYEEFEAWWRSEFPEEVEIRGYHPSIRGNERQIRRVAEVISKAHQPLICAGGGVWLAHARDELLHTMACKAAIKGGWKSAQEELEVVARAVMSGQVKYCPHGRPVAIELTRKQLEKQFKRA